MNINTENTKSFSDFLNDTRKKANRLLNRLLWFCVLAGPAIAQYISVEQDENQYPVKIIFTIQNIDNDKRREEHLIRIAMTDELTMVHNRRSYVEKLADQRMYDEKSRYYSSSGKDRRKQRRG